MARGKAFGLAVAVLVGTVAPAAALSQPEQQAVLDAHKAHCAKVQSIEFKASEKKIRNGQTIELYDYSAKCEALPDRLGHLGRFYIDTLRDSANTGKRVKRIEAFDGKTLRTLGTTIQGSENLSPGGIIRSAPARLDGQLWMSSFYALENWSYDWLFDGANVTGPMDWNGREVYVVSAFYGSRDAVEKKHNFNLYLDPTHDFAKCYSERFGADGTKAYSIEVREFVREGDIWLPALTEYNAVFADGPLTTISRFEYLRVNPQFSEDDFTLAFRSEEHTSELQSLS
jgi:hypothetical protein